MKTLTVELTDEQAAMLQRYLVMLQEREPARFDHVAHEDFFQEAMKIALGHSMIVLTQGEGNDHE